MKRKRDQIILSAAVTLCMTCTALPVIVHAEENGTAIECAHVHDEDCGYIEGNEESCQHVHDENCKVTKDDEENDNESSEVLLMNENTRSVSTNDLESGNVVFDQDGTYIIDNIDATSNTITVKEGKTVNLTIQNVNITAQDAPAILVEAGATLNLTVEGTNTLTGGNHYAAISVEPGYNADGDFDLSLSAVLNISGSGILNAHGGIGDVSQNTYGSAAGIGGNGEYDLSAATKQVDFGIIHVTSNFSGTINAEGGKAGPYVGNSSCGAGAGIGSGGFNMTDTWGWGMTCGQIIIESGTINTDCSNQNADDVAGGAGIGSGGAKGWGTAESDVSIKITGGTIQAQGGPLGAGIGGGSLCDGGNIEITGGNITAKSGSTSASYGAAGIGGGDDASCKEITIAGGTVLAQATAGGGAGIGGGTNMYNSSVHYGDRDGTISKERVGKITINGTNTKVTAYGGTGKGSTNTYGGAGIGAGYTTVDHRSVALDITIKDQATVNAYGGYHAQSIGYGYKPEDSTYYTGYGITLALDDTINLWAMNKDCYQPALVKKAQNDITTGYVQYSSTNNKYLMEYLNSDADTTVTTTGKANAYLERSANVNNPSSVDWSFAGKKMTLKNTDGKSVELDTPFDTLSGNWATIGQFEGKTQPSTEPPVIDFASAFLSGGSLILTVNDTFEPLKYVTAKDSEGNDISGDIKVVNDNVDMTKAGTYEVTYRVTDKNGNSVEKTLTVIVKEKNNNVNNVTVKYEFGNGQSDIKETVKEGASITLKGAPTRKGYVFKGWSDGTKTYQSKDTVKVSKDMTFTAVWEKEKVTKDITVKYEFGNGQSDIKETVKEGASITLKGAPTRKGYIFKGWSDGTKTYQPKDTVRITKDTTFTAVWEKEKVTKDVKVKYEFGNGQSDIKETVKEGASITLKGAPTRKGYVFKGWSDGTKTYQPKDTVTITKDTTFTAIWKKINNVDNNNSDNGNNGGNENTSTGTKDEKTEKTTSIVEVKKASENKKTKTGDESKPMLYVELGLMAVVGCAIVLLQNKKSQLLNK